MSIGSVIKRLSGMKDATPEQIEAAAKPLVEKALTPKFAAMDLVAQVRTARKIMKLMPINDFRARFIKGFEQDLLDARKRGATDEEILQPYLSCAAFMEFWASMDLNEDHLRALLAPK